MIHRAARAIATSRHRRLLGMAHSESECFALTTLEYFMTSRGRCLLQRVEINAKCNSASILKISHVGRAKTNNFNLIMQATTAASSFACRTTRERAKTVQLLFAHMRAPFELSHLWKTPQQRRLLMLQTPEIFFLALSIAGKKRKSKTSSVDGNKGNFLERSARSCKNFLSAEFLSSTRTAYSADRQLESKGDSHSLRRTFHHHYALLCCDFNFLIRAILILQVGAKIHWA